jgi:hypothetical protein
MEIENALKENEKSQKEKRVKILGKW